MKRILHSLLRQLLFWILFFDLSRLLFLLFYLQIIRIENIRLLEIAEVFWYSIKLDLATTCYILVFPFFLLVIQSIWSPRYLNYVNKAYTGIILFGYSLLAVGEMGIYAEWKTKISFKVIKYLSHPSEIYYSSETGTFFLLILILLFLFSIGLWGYLKFFYFDLIHIKRNIWLSLAFFVIVPPLLFVGMRGGVQQIPVNQSESYYSEHNILNIAAVNNAFNLYISIFENLPNFNKNPYLFMDKEKAEAIVKSVYASSKDTTLNILKTTRPNIVLLILESWSADLIEGLGGEPGITPEFKKLEKDGILFREIYATGSRSEQGMASIFGGFPAHPVSSATVQPDKFVKLPSLVHVLEKNSYSTSFYFGGQLIYGNMKSYMMYNGFDKIMEIYDFPKSYPQGKLGIHDQFILDYMLNDLGTMKKPFFATLFTISTHSPWDQPYAKPLKWGDNEMEYINAAYYTDHCLGEFFRKARLQKWFDNTLFIIVADHSHNSYRNWHPQSKEYHKIPLLLYGNVISDEFKGKVWHKLGNQHDLPTTVLTQLRIPSEDFRYSKNLLNPFSPEFAYYSTEDGVGWIRPNGYFVYDAGPDYYYWRWFENDTLKESMVNEGKAYLQVVFSEYMND